MSRVTRTDRERLEYRTNAVLEALRRLETCVSGDHDSEDIAKVLAAITAKLKTVSNTFENGRRDRVAGFSLDQ